MEESIQSNIYDELNTILEETIQGHVTELESILGRPWTNADFTRTLTRLTQLDSVEEAVNREAAHLGATDQLADLLPDYFRMCERALLASESVVAHGGGFDVLSQFKFETRCCSGGAMEGDDVCCVCLERLHCGLVATLDCRHEFHRGCIGRWLLRGRNYCPLCYADVLLL